MLVEAGAEGVDRRTLANPSHASRKYPPPPPPPVLLFLALSSWELACQQCACKDAREAERESEAKTDATDMQPDIRHTRHTDSQKRDTNKNRVSDARGMVQDVRWMPGESQIGARALCLHAVDETGLSSAQVKLQPKSWALDPEPSTLNPAPYTLHPKP